MDCLSNISLALVLSSLLQLAKLLSNWISDADLEQDKDDEKTMMVMIIVTMQLTQIWKGR